MEKIVNDLACLYSPNGSRDVDLYKELIEAIENDILPKEDSEER